MPATKTRKRTDCTQHRQPLSDCNPWDHHLHSHRFREDDYQATEDTAEAAGMPTTTRLIAHGMEVMQNYLRCDLGRCYTDGPPIPVTFGDLSGKTFGEWVARAVRQAESQHPRHEPVRIGAEPASLALVAADLDTPRSPVFREPGQ